METINYKYVLAVFLFCYMKDYFILCFIVISSCFISCDNGKGERSKFYQNNSNFYNYEPELLEQEVVRYCMVCGGTGQVMTVYGPANCNGCVLYGRPPQYIETIKVPNPNYRREGGNVSFRGKNSDGYIYVGQVTLCSDGGISNTFYLFKKGNTKYAAKYRSGPFYSLSDSYVTIDNIKYKTPR